MENVPVELVIGSVQFNQAVALLYCLCIMSVFLLQTTRTKRIVLTRKSIACTRLKFILIWAPILCLIIYFEISTILYGQRIISFNSRWLEVLKPISKAYKCTSNEVWIDLEKLSDTKEGTGLENHIMSICIICIVKIPIVLL